MYNMHNTNYREYKNGRQKMKQYYKLGDIGGLSSSLPKLRGLTYNMTV